MVSVASQVALVVRMLVAMRRGLLIVVWSGAVSRRDTLSAVLVLLLVVVGVVLLVAVVEGAVHLFRDY